MDQSAAIYLALASLIFGPLAVGLRFLTASDVTRDEWRSQLKQHYYVSRPIFDRRLRQLSLALLTISACGVGAVFYLNTL